MHFQRSLASIVRYRQYRSTNARSGAAVSLPQADGRRPSPCRRPAIVPFHYSGEPRTAHAACRSRLPWPASRRHCQSFPLPRNGARHDYFSIRFARPITLLECVALADGRLTSASQAVKMPGHHFTSAASTIGVAENMADYGC